MKRSEAINLIEKILEKNYPPTEKYYKTAAQILTLLEKKGMLPPLNEDNYHHMDNESRQEVNEAKKFYFTWEKE